MKRKRISNKYKEDDDWISSNDEDNLNYLKKIDKESYNIFKETRKEIENNIPTLISIIKENLLIKDRAKILQYYDIYTDTEQNTEKSLELQEKINTLIQEGKKKHKEYHKYNMNEHKRMKKELSILNDDIEMEQLEYNILNLNTNINNKLNIYNKYKRLRDLSNDEEYHKLKHWLWWALKLPYDNITKFKYNSKQISQLLLKVYDHLDTKIYGMKKAKEQILLYLNSKLVYPEMKNISLGLLGNPGVGKTSLARSLADILDFPFEQISLGGVGNAEFLKGHSYTYVGAQPGEIVRCLAKMKSKNGILFLDEYDKITNNKEITSTLLHITDSSQNMIFNDHFLDGLQIDLSQLWFIYSMNKLPDDKALKDRIFIIEIEDYTIEDKIIIAKNYIIPTELKRMRLLEKNFIQISDKTIKYIITNYLKEQDGIRPLERLLSNILRKLGFIYSNSENAKFTLSFWKEKIFFPYCVTEKNIKHFI